MSAVNGMVLELLSQCEIPFMFCRRGPLFDLVVVTFHLFHLYLGFTEGPYLTQRRINTCGK